jgi:AraC-like DNA-binding protein
MNSDLALLYLWPRRSLYLGSLSSERYSIVCPPPIRLSLAYSGLMISLGGQLSVMQPHQPNPIVCNSVLLPAGMDVTVSASNSLVAIFFLDATGFDFNTLRLLMRGAFQNMYYDLEQQEQFVEALLKLHAAQLEPGPAYQVVDQLLSPAVLAPTMNFRIDTRVNSVIDLIRSTATDNLSVDELAEHARLSVPRLVKIFKQQTGVPIRRYRLWHRIYLAANHLSLGASLTEAALEAGFTDAPHFCKTHRFMLGFKPSDIFGDPSSIRIFCGA